MCGIDSIASIPSPGVLERRPRPTMDTPYEKLLVSLVRAEVDFIVVGGVAVALNGFVRTTDDVEILIERSPENVAHLLDALKHFGAGQRSRTFLRRFR